MQRRAGRRPRGHRDPDRRAVGGLRLDGLAFLGACVEISGANEAPRNLISAQRGTGRHGYAHDVRRLGAAQVGELPLELGGAADIVLRRVSSLMRSAPKILYLP